MIICFLPKILWSKNGQFLLYCLAWPSIILGNTRSTSSHLTCKTKSIRLPESSEYCIYGQRQLMRCFPYLVWFHIFFSIPLVRLLRCSTAVGSIWTKKNDGRWTKNWCSTFRCSLDEKRWTMDEKRYSLLGIC
jgi:hypothetical protein